MLGADLTHLDAVTRRCDEQGDHRDRPGRHPRRPVIKSGDEQVWAKREPNGTWYIGVFNTDTSSSHTFSVPLAQLGLSGSAKITT